MRIVAKCVLVIATITIAGCVGTQDREAVREAWKTNPQFKREAIARCVERTKTMFSETRRDLRQIMRMKSDSEVGPVLCDRINTALVDGRLDPSELSWTDGLSTQSPRLIRVLQGR